MTRLALLTTALLALCFLPPAGVGCRAQAPAAPAVIVPMDQPFLFAYGTWDKKAQIDNGVASLDADGMTPQGGAGVNLSPTLDLTAHADDSPGPARPGRPSQYAEDAETDAG